MADVQTIELDGKRFVVVEEAEYERLRSAATDEPSLPPADRRGTRPALDAARAALARSIIRQRKALGLTQQQLARLAGLRQETVSRLESAKHSASTSTVDKLDRALHRTSRRRRKTG